MADDGGRGAMVDSLVHEAGGDLEAERVARAMRAVPREPFVPEDERAYLDRPFRHRGTRVLAPSSAARLLAALDPRPGDDVLVVGAGVGYTVAVVADVVGARHTHAVDIDRRLVYDARSNLAEAGYGAVLVDRGDGAEGLPTYAPFDRVLVEAAAVRPPAALLDQVAPGGRLVLPEGVGAPTLTAYEGGEPVADFGSLELDPLLVEGEQAGAVERNRTAREERERAAREAETRAGWEQDWLDWD